jgi:hypothetical protein
MAGCARGSLPFVLEPGVSQASSGCRRERILQHVNLHPPRTGGRRRRGEPAGIAEVSTSNCGDMLAIVAQHMRPNGKRTAYGVWLYTSRAHSRLLGFLSPPVAHSGRPRTQGRLPHGWRHFRRLVISRETTGRPGHPHHVVLVGSFVRQRGFTG